MADFWSCVIAEFKALGIWCVIHGPEIWLGVVVWCVLSICILLGMWLGALLTANRRDDDDDE